MEGFASCSTICLSKSNFLSRKLLCIIILADPIEMSILDFWRKSELMRILLIGRAQKGYFGRRVKIKSADGGNSSSSYSINEVVLS